MRGLGSIGSCFTNNTNIKKNDLYVLLNPSLHLQSQDSSLLIVNYKNITCQNKKARRSLHWKRYIPRTVDTFFF